MYGHRLELAIRRLRARFLERVFSSRFDVVIWCVQLPFRRRPELPLYEYACLKCKRHTDKIEKLNGPHLKKCPHCGGKVESVITAPAIQFKGSGWYVTDYGRKTSGGDSGKSEKGEKPEKSEKSEKTEKSEKSEKSESKSESSAKDQKKTGSASKDK